MLSSFGYAEIVLDKLINYEYYTRQSVGHKANMGSMPVYDQGDEGSCVTQAISSVINVLHYKRANYVSTNCILNLGNFFENQDLEYFNNKKNIDLYTYNKAIGRKSYPSGWEGSYPYLITSQIATYGIIPKTREYICGEPKSGLITPKKTELFARHPLNNQNWSVICDNGIRGKTCDLNSINKIKQAIDKNNLVVLGILVTQKDMEYKYYEKNKNGQQPNVWAFTPSIYECLSKKEDDCKEPILGGHAIVAYGYREDPYKSSEGIFYVHNSWGTFSGDKGDYYITYRYLENLLSSAIAFSR
jgi:hypothetical protein